MRKRRQFSSLPTASGGIARAAYARALEARLEVGPLLKSSDLTTHQIKNSHARMPCNNQIKFLNLVADELPDPFLGIHLAEGIDLREMGLLYVLIDPKFPPANLGASELRAAASTIGQPLAFLNASADAELEATFAALTQQHVTAMLLIGSPFFDTRRDKIITFAAQQKLPTMYHFREYVVDGGLMSYGPSLGEAYREIGIYAARILNGATPADLPVVESTKLELVINLKTAKTLGLTIPASFLSLADELVD